MFFALTNIFRLFFLFIFCSFIFIFDRNKAIYIFLKFSGPTFIKLGQLLANRPDLVGDELAEILSDFQDKLPAFSFQKVKKTIENEFKKELREIFSDFSIYPVSSASIAQVHKAKTLSGDIVAVKILRPRIHNIVARDILTLKLLQKILSIFSSFLKEKISSIIKLLENCSARELDLYFEAASASEIKYKLQNLEGFYIPKIYWQLVSNKIMVLEWIDGIPFSNKKEILDSKFNKRQIAKNLVVSYFNQVYVHGMFHADMHLGNLFLMKNGDIAAVDFGIIGFIDKKTRIAVAEILIAFLNKDYHRVAKLHIDAELVKENIDFDEFVLSCRIIGESIVDRSVKEISMANLLANLLKMTKRYEMETKPELLLLQKTMMLIEGVGIFLDKDLNIWDLARPFVKDWANHNIGFDAKIRDSVLDILEVIKRFPDKLNNDIERSNLTKLEEKINRIKIKERKWKLFSLFLTLIILAQFYVK